jgi:hypothetical protein
VRWWLFGFVLTLVFELPVYALALRRPLGGLGRALAVGVAVNLATHPLAWMLAVGGLVPWVGIEGAVTVAEAAMLFAAARGLGRRLPAHEAFLVSLAANALSAGVGLLNPVATAQHARKQGRNAHSACSQVRRRPVSDRHYLTGRISIAFCSARSTRCANSTRLR